MQPKLAAVRAELIASGSTALVAPVPANARGLRRLRQQHQLPRVAAHQHHVGRHRRGGERRVDRHLRRRLARRDLAVLVVDVNANMIHGWPLLSAALTACVLLWG